MLHTRAECGNSLLNLSDLPDLIELRVVKNPIDLDLSDTTEMHNEFLFCFVFAFQQLAIFLYHYYKGFLSFFNILELTINRHIFLLIRGKVMSSCLFVHRVRNVTIP